MKRLAILSVLLTLSGPASSGSLSLLGAGGGGGGGGGGYTGPGNLTLTGTIKAYWGLRCITATYSGNVADVKSPSGTSHTLITCDGAGNLVATSPTDIATVCATSCTIIDWYDQSGALACGGAACTLNQATEARRATYIASGVGGHPVARFVGANTQNYASGSITLSQPIAYVYTANRGSSSAQMSVINSGSYVQAGYAASTNTTSIYAGSTVSGTASDATWHNIMGVFNNPSSAGAVYVDGSSVATGNPGAGSMSSAFVVGQVANTQYLTADVAEIAMYATTAMTSGDASTWSTNAKAYWGY